MTTSAQHVIITIMLHICAGHPRIHHNRILHCVYCGSMEHSSVQCCNRRIPPEATRNEEFQHTNSEILGKVGFQSTTNEEPASHIPTGCIVKFWATQALTNQITIILNFLGETRTIAVDTQLENKIIMITILVQVLGIMGTS